jgi:hypothetical protein
MSLTVSCEVDQSGRADYVRAVRWLAYVHPVFMLALLALALLVLREGLGIRRARLARAPFDASRHRRLARVLVPAVVAGAVLGVVSIVWLRGDPPTRSVHFPIALGAAALMSCAGVLGLVLERGGGGRTRAMHALCGALGVLLALAAAVAGMAILP